MLKIEGLISAYGVAISTAGNGETGAKNHDSFQVFPPRQRQFSRTYHDVHRHGEGATDGTDTAVNHNIVPYTVRSPKKHLLRSTQRRANTFFIHRTHRA